MQVHFSQALYKSIVFIFFKARLVYYYKIITLFKQPGWLNLYGGIQNYLWYFDPKPFMSNICPVWQIQSSRTKGSDSLQFKSV